MNNASAGEDLSVFDLTIWLGQWPFRRLRHAGVSGVRGLMQRTGTSGGLAVPLQGAFYKNPAEAAEEMLEEMNGASDLVPCAAISPLFPGWERDLRRLAQEGGCRACALFPTYHSYQLYDAPGQAILGLLEEMAMPTLLFLRLQDERSHPPLMQVPPLPMTDVAYALKCYPDLPLAVCNANLPAESPALLDALDRPAPTLLTTSYKSLQLAQVASSLGADHLAYASAMPMFYPESALRQVLDAPMGDEERGMILWDNARSFLGLGGRHEGC